jgi:ABC-type transporter Mla subunit MlaD
MSVQTEGLLGDYYLEFDGGSAESPFLPDDGTAVVDGESGSIMDEMARDLSLELRGIGKRAADLMDNLNNIIGDGAFRENIRLAVANVRDASEEAPETVREIRLTAQSLKELAADIQGRIDAHGKDWDALSQGFSRSVTAINEALTSLNDILDRFREGKGTVGSLIGKDELYEKLVKTVDETNATLAEMKELIVLIRKNPSVFLWGK